MIFTTRIHEAASTDPTRPVLTTVNVAGGFAYATDSYIAARAPVVADDGETEDPISVPATAAKAAWTSTGKTGKSHRIVVTGEGSDVLGPKATTSFKLNLYGAKHPNLDPLIDAAVERFAGSESKLTFGINVANLLRAAKAVGTDAKNPCVRITVDAEVLRPILVEPLNAAKPNEPKAQAIVMPIRVGT